MKVPSVSNEYFFLQWSVQQENGENVTTEA